MKDAWMNMKKRTLLIVVGAALLVGASAGCRYNDVDAFIVGSNEVVARKPYTVAPPDVLTVLTTQVPEINQASAVVHPDGKIYLPLLGAVFVAGLNQDEIARLIETRAREYYKDVRVIVQISSYNSKSIYVWGEVGTPGQYKYNGSDTVMDILSKAQPSRLADMNRVQIFRPTPDGKLVKRMTIELDKWVETGAIERNAILADGDIVYVPPNGLARVGLALQQLLLPITPAANVVQGPGTIDEAVKKGPYGPGQAGQ